jgi:hypothetical protein
MLPPEMAPNLRVICYMLTSYGVSALVNGYYLNKKDPFAVAYTCHGKVVYNFFRMALLINDTAKNALQNFEIF